MKQKLFVIVSILMLFLMVGCKTENENYKEAMRIFTEIEKVANGAADEDTEKIIEEYYDEQSSKGAISLQKNMGEEEKKFMSDFYYLVFDCLVYFDNGEKRKEAFLKTYNDFKENHLD